MTDKVYHSFGRSYRSRAAATAIQYAGGSEGWVVPSTERLMDDPEGDLATGSLNAFGESHSGTSFDVTIDTGEALVGGAYLARDTTTTVTLSSSTSNQTVYVGWQDSATDSVIVGKSGAFGSNDPKIPIWTFDTDGSGVTSATDERVLSQREASAGGGITYVQSTEPEYSEGSNWINPSNGVYYGGYDGGSGGDWHPIPPITVTEEAVDFTENDVSVSTSDTEIIDGSIRLIKGVFVDDWEDGDISGWSGNTGSLSNQQTTVLTESWTGELTASSDNPSVDSPSVGDTRVSVELKTRLGSDTGNSSDKVRVMIRDSSGNTIFNLEFQDSTGDLNVNGSAVGSWSPDTTYRFFFRWDWDNDQAEIFRDGSSLGTYAFANSANDWDYVRWVNDTRFAGVTRTAWIDNANNGRTSGSATISWPSPSEINSWDLATFQRTLDNESVTIDVLDGAGNVLFSDISQNFDISTVSTSKDVQIRANLSRNDTANNPTLDYAARRFTR